jgi:MFS family permease
MKINYKLVGSGIVGLGLAGSVGYLSYYVAGDNQSAALNLLIVALGLALGWLLGILLSPYSDEEGKKFTQYAKAFGVFVSGYLVGKIDKVVEEVLKPDFILDSVHGFRGMAFLASAIIAIVITFVFRRYG